MTTSLALDPRGAQRLAVLDPALAHLAEGLPAESPGRRWLLHDARWTPGQGCRLAYRVTESDSPSTFVDLRITETGWTQRDYRTDPALPGLPLATDPAVVASLLAADLGVVVRSVHIDPVRYRPGARCVLRFDVVSDRGAATLYAKVFRPSEFPARCSLVHTLGATTAYPRLTPALVAVWPALQTLVMEAVPGRVLSTVLADPHMADEEKATLGYRLGRLLALFHDGAALPLRARSADGQLMRIADSLTAAGCVDHHLANRFAEVLTHLARRIPAPGKEICAHGAFRTGQVVLAADGRLVVLDVDSACRSDACLDLGTELAHLAWQGVRRPELQACNEQVALALLSGYQDLAGALDLEALGWWRAAGLLQVASRRFRRLETHDWYLAPALLEMASRCLPTSAPPRRRPPVRRQSSAPRVEEQIVEAVLERNSARVVSATRLTSAPGRRSVVRYELQGVASGRTRSVVGKSFAEPRRAFLLHQHLHLLSDGPFRDGSLRVPSPVALLPAAAIVLYEHADGTPLSDLAELDQLVAGARDAAAWLARLHTSAVRFPRVFSVHQERITTAAWAAAIGSAQPALGTQAEWVAARWAGAVQPATYEPGVPIHKDFHSGHVLIGAHVEVIDLDEARQGDPAFDLAHFCAYAEGRFARPAAQSVRSAFLAEYAARTGWQDKGAFAPYEAYAWLKIARQVTAGVGPFRNGSEILRRGAREALERGTRCLSG